MFQFLDGFLPRKLKDMFRWCEYLYYNSTHIYAAAQRLSDYAITDVIYDTENAELRKKYKKVFEDIIKIKKLLKSFQRDRIVYGNVIFTFFMAIKRMAYCEKCKTASDLSRSKFKYDFKKIRFDITCPSCNKRHSKHIDDLDEQIIRSPEGIRITRWDPKLIDIDHNPITQESEYYYNIPGFVKKKVKNGDPLFIATMPKSILEAISKDKLVKFSKDNLFHMKVDAPAGIDPQWGFPPLASTLKKFYYAALLRKANEAIALDFIVPFRVLHPAQSSGSMDPVKTISLSNWVENTKREFRQWRKDPLHIMFSPVAVGVSQVGGQGRALMTMGEIQQAEDDIIASMGLPREFLYGGLSFTGSSVTLRMLENQLINDSADLKDALNWIAQRTAMELNWEHMTLDLTPFKFIDDVAQKGMELQTNATYNHLSKRSIAEMYGRDLDDERKQQIQDAIEDARQQKEIEKRIQELEASMAAQAEQIALQGQGGQGLNYDQQAVIAKAEEVAYQIADLEYGTKKSYLAQLQNEDYVLYSVVIQRLEALDQQQDAGYMEAGAEMQ